VIGRLRGAAMLACLGLGVADLAVLNLAVLPALDLGGSTSTPALALEPVHRHGDVQLGTVSLVHAAPVVEAPPAPAEPYLTLSFRKASHRVERQARKLLDVELAALASAPRLVVIGHSDPSGPVELNERLSAERASAVARYLRQQGIAAERLQVEFRGAREPREGVEPRRVDIFVGGSP
jgi:outer membrane protein OmpA-like peptidoglycan-associated protein